MASILSFAIKIYWASVLLNYTYKSNQNYIIIRGTSNVSHKLHLQMSCHAPYLSMTLVLFDTNLCAVIGSWNDVILSVILFMFSFFNLVMLMLLTSNGILYPPVQYYASSAFSHILGHTHISPFSRKFCSFKMRWNCPCTSIFFFLKLCYLFIMFK